MAISLTKPDVGTVDWTSAINQNFTDIETALNARKVASANVDTSGTTLTADSDLQVSLASGKTYGFFIRASFLIKSATDLKWDMNFTGSSSSYAQSSVGIWDPNTGAGGGVTSDQAPATALNTTRTILYISDVYTTLLIYGRIVTTSAGTLQFRWARNSGTTPESTRYAGSQMDVWEV